MSHAPAATGTITGGSTISSFPLIEFEGIKAVNADTKKQMQSRPPQSAQLSCTGGVCRTSWHPQLRQTKQRQRPWWAALQMHHGKQPPIHNKTQALQALLAIAMAAAIWQPAGPAFAQCAGASAVTPVTSTDESSTIAGGRQLVNGNNTVVDTTVPSQIKINVNQIPKYNLLAKSASFTASDAAGSFYQITASTAVTVTLPTSPADGTVYKFKRVSGAAVVTFNASGTDTIDNAGFVASTLTLNNGGVIELVAVTGGWQVT
jgi:hypothetical protein